MPDHPVRQPDHSSADARCHCTDRGPSSLHTRQEVMPLSSRASPTTGNANANISEAHTSAPDGDERQSLSTQNTAAAAPQTPSQPCAPYQDAPSLPHLAAHHHNLNPLRPHTPPSRSSTPSPRRIPSLAAAPTPCPPPAATPPPLHRPPQTTPHSSPPPPAAAPPRCPPAAAPRCPCAP